MNSAAVSPPRNRMKRAPSPLTLLSPAREPLFPCIMWMSGTPRSGAKPNVGSPPLSTKDSPKAMTTASASRLGPFDLHSRSADGRRNSEADVRVAGRIDCCGGSERSPASSRRKRWCRQI